MAIWRKTEFTLLMVFSGIKDFGEESIKWPACRLLQPKRSHVYTYNFGLNVWKYPNFTTFQTFYHIV